MAAVYSSSTKNVFHTSSSNIASTVEKVSNKVFYLYKNEEVWQ